jgi:hypothetical protein
MGTHAFALPLPPGADYSPAHFNDPLGEHGT